MSKYIHLPRQLCMQISSQRVIGLVQRSLFLKYHKYWTIVETRLRYLAIVQNQTDVAARQSMGVRVGQLLYELLAAAHLPALDMARPDLCPLCL